MASRRLQGLEMEPEFSEGFYMDYNLTLLFAWTYQ